MEIKDMKDDRANKASTVKQQYFFDRPEVINWLLRIFYGICIFLILIDFLIHRHIETSVESVPAFYAIYGFIACAILVLTANQLRKLLMREESYYDSDASLNNSLSNSEEQYKNEGGKK